MGVPGPWEGRLLSEAAWIALRVEGGGERPRPGHRGCGAGEPGSVRPRRNSLCPFLAACAPRCPLHLDEAVGRPDLRAPSCRRPGICKGAQVQSRSLGSRVVPGPELQAAAPGACGGAEKETFEWK